MSDLEKKCDAFENAWRATLVGDQHTPSIEEFLQDLDGENRDSLLRELLLLEWEFGDVQEHQQIEPYLQRFPDAKEIVEQAFQMHLETLKHPKPSPQPDANAPPALGDSRFQVLKFHRAGGLGKVWIAKDTEVDREVALKEIKSAYADHPSLRHRFVVEAEVTGKLEHPGVVPVYGLGKRPNGQPFYAMRFIRGNSLLDEIKHLHRQLQRTKTPLAQSAEFRGLLRRFVSVCQTMDYAHSRSVLHRDLKPANIMLGPFGETLVVDWGLAKVLDDAKPAPAVKFPASKSQPVASSGIETLVLEQDLSEGPLPISANGLLQTRKSTTMGTLAYMSPEQAGAEELTPASDIYSLGATLYHLLTNEIAFTGTGLHETIQRVKAGDFPRPRLVIKGIPLPLEAVCLKSMALRPEDRYESAGELAAEIDRWLDDEPVHARRETWWETWGRWVRRNRTSVSVGLIALVLIATLTSTAALIINSLRNQESAARVMAEENAERARRGFYASQLFSASQLLTADPGRALELLNDLNACPEDLRCFVWSHYYRACRRDRIRWQAHKAAALGDLQSQLAGFAADGNLISVDAKGSIKSWNIDDGQLVSEIETGKPIFCCTLDPTRQLLATGGAEEPIRLWNAANGKASGSFPGAPGIVVDLAFSPDGEYLVSLHDTPSGSEIVVWKIATQAEIGRYSGPAESRVIAVSPSGDRLAIGGAVAQTIEASDDQRDAELVVVRLTDGAQLHRLRLDLNAQLDDSISCLSFIDDQSLLICSAGVLARIAPDTNDQDTLVPQEMTVAHNGSIRSLEIHQTSANTLAVTAGTGTGAYLDLSLPHQPVVLWDAQGLERQSYLAGIVGEVTDVVLDPTGFTIAVLNKDGSIAIHEIGSDWTKVNLGHPGPVQAIAFNDTGTELTGLVSSLQGDALWFWDTTKRQQRKPDEKPGETDAFWFPSRIASGGVWLPDNSGSIRILDPRDGSVLGDVSLTNDDRLAAVSADGQLVAISNPSGRIVVNELSSGRAVATLDVDPAQSLTVAAFSYSGRLLAWVDRQNRLQLWALDQQRPTSHELNADRIAAITFSPDDAIVAMSTSAANPNAVSGDRVTSAKVESSLPPVRTRSGTRRMHASNVMLWHVASGKIQSVLRGHTGTVQAIAFSPDGATVATGGLDWDVKLWDSISGTEVASAPHVGPVTAIAFSPDGLTLATASQDQSVRLWLSATDEFVIRQEAIRLAATMQDSVPLKSEMLKRVRNIDNITENVRQRTLSMLENFQEDPEWLNQWSWDVVRVPQRSDSDYSLAVQAAKKALTLREDDPAILNTLGAALYRKGRIDEAIETLIQSSQRAQQEFGGDQPADHAFLAMAYAVDGKMERAEQHRRQFARLVSILTRQQNTTAVAELATLLEEVSRVLDEHRVY